MRRFRPGRPEPPITANQRSYLDAFDAMLRGEPCARDLMEERLMPVLADAGLDPASLEREQARRPYLKRAA